MFGQEHEQPGGADGRRWARTTRRGSATAASSSTTRTPGPGQGALATLNQALHFEIAGLLIIDVMGLQIGYSLGQAIGEHKGFGDCAECTVDLWVSMPPTGASRRSAFKLRGLSGEKVAFAIEGLGWRQGSFHLEGISLPDGVVIMIADVVGIVIQEIGVSAEQGASYLSFTAGLLLKLPAGFEGGARRDPAAVPDRRRPEPAVVEARRLLAVRARARRSCSRSAATSPISVVDGTRVREFGFTGTLGLKLQAVEWVFGMDLLAGERRVAGGVVQVLHAAGLLPRLDPDRAGSSCAARASCSRTTCARSSQPADPSSRDLRYFNWYQNSNPIDVPGDRRLAAWQAENEAWSFGIGVGASIAAARQGDRARPVRPRHGRSRPRAAC